MSLCRIPIHERVELPEAWMPADSRVEIDAKITAGMTSELRLAVVQTEAHELTQAASSRLLHDRPPNDRRRTEGGAGPRVGGVSDPED